MAHLAGGGVLGFLGGETNLDGVVAIVFESLDLDHCAGSGFDHGDRHEHVLCIVDLGHAEFLT
jgi:hypothetical protein